MKKDFLAITDCTQNEIIEIFDLSTEIKQKLRNGEIYHPLKGQTLAMIFSKPSARTRVSFETGMFQLGGHALYLSPNDIGIGKREAVKDIARVLSGFNDGIMARLFGHEDIVELAQYANIPVINGLTDLVHPCQIMADLFTVKEHRGNLDELKIVYVGDGNNVANSWINMAARIPMHLVIACPEGYEPNQEIFSNAKDAGLSVVEVMNNPQQAVKNADVIYTDVWASMGQESETEARKKIFASYQVNSELVGFAKNDVFIMHCLPAHRGEEITDDVIESSNSIVFDEAENRMHVQKAIMVKLMEKK